MPRTSRSRTIDASRGDVWELVCDPHQLPRWWPRVSRVEGVREGAFTEVLLTSKGRPMRADFELVHADEREGRVVWSQRLQGTPFGRVLRSAETEVCVERDGPPVAAAGRVRVTIELRQTLTGVFPRLGRPIVTRAAGATLERALDGLEAILG